MNGDVIGVLVILALVALGYGVYRFDHMPFTPGGRAELLVGRHAPRLACRIYCGVRDGIDWRCSRCVPPHQGHGQDVLDGDCPGCVHLAGLLGIDLGRRS